jgi:hypothetical protein
MRLGLRRLPLAFSARNGGILAAGLLGACGAFFVAQSLLLDLGGIALPGPGFFPLALGTILLGCAALIALDCWQSCQAGVMELGHRDVLITIAALLMVPVIFEPLGAHLTLGLLGAAMLVLIGRVAPPLAVIAAGAGILACWYFFEVLLGVELPAGQW